MEEPSDSAFFSAPPWRCLQVSGEVTPDSSIHGSRAWGAAKIDIENARTTS